MEGGASAHGATRRPFPAYPGFILPIEHQLSDYAASIIVASSLLRLAFIETLRRLSALDDGTYPLEEAHRQAELL